MKIKSIAISLILSTFIFTGCTNKVFMPYEDQPLCSAGVNSGYCGSVSDVYQQKIADEQNK